MSSHKNRKGTGKQHSSHASHQSHHAGAARSSRDSQRSNRFKPKQYLIVGALAAVAFFGAYSVARSGNNADSATPSTAQTAAVTPITAADAAARASAGAATIENGVQKVSVQVGFKYNPDVIRLKAGIPAEITFGEGQGCTSVVQSQALGFQEDLSTGPKTVKLQALKPGTYEFACGMNMVRGQIVVS